MYIFIFSVVSSQSGTVTSHNWPESSNSNEDACTTTIKINDNNQFKIFFFDFDIPPTDEIGVCQTSTGEEIFSMSGKCKYNAYTTKMIHVNNSFI